MGTFFIVNMMCILSLAYIDVIVPYNVPHILEVGPLDLCLSPGRQWAPKLCVSARVSNKIDLRSGYWQMPVNPRNVHKTAFKTRWELYEFLVMPFGVTNALAQFMNMMKDLLGECLDKFVLVFLDDVLIYSANPQDHVEYLRKVLGKL